MPWVLVGSDNVDFDVSTEMLLPDYDDDQTPEDEELPEGDTNFGNEIEELAKVNAALKEWLRHCVQKNTSARP